MYIYIYVYIRIDINTILVIITIITIIIIININIININININNNNNNIIIIINIITTLAKAGRFGHAAGTFEGTPQSTANLPSKILDLRGFNSDIILILRGGILMSIGNPTEIMSHQILVGIILAGRLGVRESPRKWTPGDSW